MKQFIFLLLVFLPFCTFSQVNETFGGREIGNDWLGDRNLFFINSDGRLQMNIQPERPGNASIGMNIPYASDMQWEFDVQMNGTPSDKNKLHAYLYREKDMFYYVQIGFSGNKKLGLRRKGEKDMFERLTNDFEKGAWVHIKITLEDYKNWTMYVRRHGDSYYTRQGACLCPVHPEERGQFSFKFYYTKTMSGLFSIDNVKILHAITPTDTITGRPDISGPSTEDLPALNEIRVADASTLQFVFDKAVNVENAVFSITGIGNAIRKSYADGSQAVINTLFSEELQPDEAYTISYSGISDLTGNQLPAYSEEVIFEEEKEEPEEFQKGTVRINEIMADPKGLKLLPETEYVELYNVSSSPVSLSGWKLSYGGSAKPIGNVGLPAGAYAVLFREGREISVDEGGLAVPMANFPAALANTGKTLQLLDVSGNVIDEVTYPKATPARSWEQTSGTWKLSVDSRGGTPGSPNSYSAGEPDEPGEPAGPDEPGYPEIPVAGLVLPGEIVFNEILPDPYAGGSEYIELYNRSDKTLSINNLSVSVRKTDGTLGTRYPLSPVTQPINPGDYVLLTKSAEGVSSFYLLSSPDAVHELPRLPILANTASTLVLFRKSDETIIDEVSYSSKWHASSIKDKKGVALERISPEEKTQNPANWTSASASSGFGTPGYRNSQYRTSPENATGIETPVYMKEGSYYSIRYHLEQSGYNCRIFIYNIRGMLIAEIANHELLGTSGELTWDGNLPDKRRLSPGVYLFYAEIYHHDGKTQQFKKPFLIY